MARKINLLPLRSHLFCEVHQSYCYEDKYIMMNKQNKSTPNLN